MKKSILITGGAGFIGSHTVAAAIKKYPEYMIVNLDKLTYASNLDNLKDIESTNYVFVEGDICDESLVDKLFEKYEFEYILHLAAESHVDKSIENPKIFIQTNIEGTRVLLDAARKYGIKRFLHVSTDEVYGDLSHDDPAFTEGSPIRPSSPYAASKAGSDFLALAYARTYEMPIVVSRCSNNYGPNQDGTKLIPVIIRRAMKDEKIPIYGDGSNIRDWLYVEDHVSALLAILEKGKNAEVYNIGGDNEKTNLELVKDILQILDKSESLIEFVKDRAGHDMRYAINASKIKSELGWGPSENHTDNLNTTIRYFIKQ